MKGFKDLFTALAAVFLGLAAGAILMLAIGSNPLEGFAYLFRGGLMNVERIGNTLATATTLTLTGLAMAFAFRTGLFSIGASGQMLVGGLAATALGLGLHLPKAAMLPLMLLAATAAGAAWGFVPGYLKARFNVHEVVSTIMLNWIAYWTVYYAVPAYFKAEYLETESARIPEYASLKVAWLTRLSQGSFLNLGIFVALACAVLVAIVLNRTTLGFELKAVGFNRHAAEFAGIDVPRKMALSLGISGALAGLAGATFYVGYAVNMQIGVLPSQGMDGVAVALLGANSPLGVVLSALFFGILHSGKGFMNAMTKIPPEIGDTIIAVIIYFAATSVLFTRVWDAITARKRRKA
ncbi:MAG TPA: ABC transporter permease [Spirochaetales bacterium]|nr:ABC transporter permease [Spirochaetales bacterium]HRY54978.1 ABC transporter permease [Spirochaetia bacterium]HRZ64384.1 ABC transporter permease [Spirochaetia bacterium]